MLSAAADMSAQGASVAALSLVQALSSKSDLAVVSAITSFNNSLYDRASVALPLIELTCVLQQ